jgi:hypothetical protein
MVDDTKSLLFDNKTQKFKINEDTLTQFLMKDNHLSKVSIGKRSAFRSSKTN